MPQDPCGQQPADSPTPSKPESAAIRTPPASGDGAAPPEDRLPPREAAHNVGHLLFAFLIISCALAHASDGVLHLTHVLGYVLLGLLPPLFHQWFRIGKTRSAARIWYARVACRRTVAWGSAAAVALALLIACFHE